MQGRWRLQSGQLWHRILQERTLSSMSRTVETKAAFEVSISGSVLIEDWCLKLSGRIDQVLSSNSSHVFREVKSVRRSLPEEEDALRQTYPHYFLQAATYLYLGTLIEPWKRCDLDAELLFVDIDEGISQILRLDSEESEKLCQSQLDNVGQFLRERTLARQHRRNLRFDPPFASFREGQEETRHRIRSLAATCRCLLLEAPTGFGKTGIALEYGLECLQKGIFDRIVYLTGKSTGQLQVTEQLGAMLHSQSGVKFFQLRNQSEHAIPDAPPDTFDRQAEPERWRELGLRPIEIFENQTIGIEAIKRIGFRSGIRPYAISRSLLPFADIWICDYNYCFAPSVRAVLDEVPGYAPDQTLLIIDEAHNLPDRVADGFSFEFNSADARIAGAQLQLRQWPEKLVKFVHNLACQLDQFKPSERLDDLAAIELTRQIEEISEFIQNTALPWEHADEFLVDWLWQISAAATSYRRSDLDGFIWSPQKGSVRYSCLDASAAIAPVFEAFAQTFLMSATLEPIDNFKTRIGIAQSLIKAEYVEAFAPWREHAYKVAVDARVDTRYKAREKSVSITAETIAHATVDQSSPTAVFFPSFDYAKNVARQIGRIAPFVRVALSPRGANLTEQTSFIEESLLFADAIFIVLGTGFSEGIDLLGGRISQAIVVSPALPQVNPITQAALEQRHSMPKSQAFREVFQIPAAVKINQALGRLVRAPGHQARVLLHGERFADPDFQKLLSNDYQTDRIIRTDHDFHQWLRE